ncbi:hypothetical protein AC579_7623 [Pseudocercospora musae]|uniref:Uncharacterized protein n=1 Tax=Pseudocercospora musae TaxID=113226 RepID=A0A139GUW9_9PEZI|nr:hypothetical protein AC579_7623 [Pseudocercospora musae]
MSAATRAFATLELLEAILLEIWETILWQTGGVLISQRVNRAFRSCILGSPEIQRRLGLKVKIIRVPVPIFSHLRAPRLNRLAYRALTKLKGLEGVQLLTHPTETLTLRQFDLEMALKDNSASFLMYLRSPMSEYTIILISQMERRRRLELTWRSAQVTFKVQPFGVLVKMAMSLQNPADDIERIEELKNWWNVNSQYLRGE